MVHFCVRMVAYAKTRQQIQLILWLVLLVLVLLAIQVSVSHLTKFNWTYVLNNIIKHTFFFKFTQDRFVKLASLFKNNSLTVNKTVRNRFLFQVSPCLLNPCKNGGVCQQFGSLGYVCSCVNGFSGYNCTVFNGYIL